MLSAEDVIVAQIPLVVGGIETNLNNIIETIQETDNAGNAKLIVFPEMTITGYPLEDLADNKDIRSAASQAIRRIHRLYQENELKTPSIVGGLHVVQMLNGVEAAVNAAFFFQANGNYEIFVKNNLPNTGVFDEERNFISSQETPQHKGPFAPTIEIDGSKVGVMICHDMWEPAAWPFNSFTPDSVDLTVVINGSPYEFNKQNKRLELARQLAEQSHAPVLYVNRVGGQDEIIFDGQSFYIDTTGSAVQFPAFVKTIAAVSEMQKGISAWGTADPSAQYPETPEQYSELWDALVIGLRDYTLSCGFKKIVIGVSGGIDSALIGALAAEAVGGKNIIAISMPSPYSSQGSLDDAEALAMRHGMDYRVMPITPMMETFNNDVYKLSGVPAENLQSRLRGLILMSISNQESALTLACGNKTELSVGYSTIYGDSVGGYAPIRDLPKTTVWGLARWRNELAVTEGKAVVIPENSIEKPASAELAPGQVDENELPPYEVLDDMLDMYIRQGLTYWTIANKHGQERANWLMRAVKNAEWKRRQYPIGLKVTALSFGKERRMPIMNSWKNQR